MDKNKNFFKTIGKAFHPGKYDELSERISKDSFKYFFSFMFIAFIFLILVSIPWLIQGPGYINGQLDKFDTLEISIDTEMNSAVIMPETRPRRVA